MHNNSAASAPKPHTNCARCTLSQPQANHFNSPYAFSMGLPHDPQGYSSRALTLDLSLVHPLLAPTHPVAHITSLLASKDLWVDTYGWSIGRDIEPSVQGGSAIFDLMASCLRVVRCEQRGSFCARHSPTPT